MNEPKNLDRPLWICCTCGTTEKLIPRSDAWYMPCPSYPMEEGQQKVCKIERLPDEERAEREDRI